MSDLGTCGDSSTIRCSRASSSRRRMRPDDRVGASRIEQSHTNRVQPARRFLPAVDAGASASRGRQNLSFPVATIASASLQAAWSRSVRRQPPPPTPHRLGSRPRTRSGTTRAYRLRRSWVDVHVAARLPGAARADRGGAASRAEPRGSRSGAPTPASSRRQRSARAGERGPGQRQRVQQRAQCDIELKSLVALTGIAEPLLIGEMRDATARLPQPAQLGVSAVPHRRSRNARSLQRERDVVAASSDIAQAQAQRLPRISLAEASARRASKPPASRRRTVWSLGPLAVTLPIFDAGAREANVEAARARYDEAVVAYGGRRAARCARSSRHSSRCRAPRPHARRADRCRRLQRVFRATEARYRGGLASLSSRGRTPQRPAGAGDADHAAARACAGVDHAVSRAGRRVGPASCANGQGGRLTRSGAHDQVTLAVSLIRPRQQRLKTIADLLELP